MLQLLKQNAKMQQQKTQARFCIKPLSSRHPHGADDELSNMP